MTELIEFKLPELGENISQGDLVRLMVEPGATVNAGQSVMELETDKAVVEVPSSVSGTVQEIRVKEGEKIKVGQVIFTVDGAETKAEAAGQGQTATPASAVNETPAAAVSQQKPKPVPAVPAPAPSVAPPSAPSSAPAGSSEFKLPELGENISQGDLVRLMVSAGTKVSEGQPVMELETDKAVVEVPSSVSGVVKEIKVKEGEKVRVGQVIFTLEGGALAPPAKAAPEPVEHVSGQQAARLAFHLAMKAEGKTEEQALPPDRPQPALPTFTMPVQLGKVAGTEHRDPVPAAPSVRRLARELGLDIYNVAGAGPGGRISEDDVKAHAKATLAAAMSAAQAPQATRFA